MSLPKVKLPKDFPNQNFGEDLMELFKKFKIDEIFFKHYNCWERKGLLLEKDEDFEANEIFVGERWDYECLGVPKPPEKLDVYSLNFQSGSPCSGTTRCPKKISQALHHKYNFQENGENWPLYEGTDSLIKMNENFSLEFGELCWKNRIIFTDALYKDENTFSQRMIYAFLIPKTVGYGFNLFFQPHACVHSPEETV